MIRKFSVVAVGFALASAALTACGSSESSAGAGDDCQPTVKVDTIKQGELTVAGFVSPPSVTIVDGTRDQLGGIDTEVVKKLADEACLTMVQKTTSPAAGVGDLDSKRIDILIGGIGYTAERAEAFGASEEMYSQPMAALSKSGVSTIDEMAAAGGVGVVQGYRWQDDLQKALGKSVKVYQSSDAMLGDLKSGRIEVGTLDLGEAKINAEKLDVGLEVEPIAPDERVAATTEPAKVVILYTKGNSSLGDALNGVIDAMKQDGTMDKLLEESGLSPS